MPDYKNVDPGILSFEEAKFSPIYNVNWMTNVWSHLLQLSWVLLVLREVSTNSTAIKVGLASQMLIICTPFPRFLPCQPNWSFFFTIFAIFWYHCASIFRGLCKLWFCDFQSLLMLTPVVETQLIFSDVWCLFFVFSPLLNGFCDRVYRFCLLTFKCPNFYTG